MTGCNPFPLASYFKALGLAKILAEHGPDRNLRFRWEGNVFVLETMLTRDEIVAFFLAHYRPTPLVSPWNAGSGFYFQEGKSNARGADGKKIKTGVRDQETAATRSISAVGKSSGLRLEAYRHVIASVKKKLEALKREAAPKEEEKKTLFQAFRNSLPDELLPWLDAAFLISEDELIPPPLLLSGGNEGNLDFSNTFLQNVLALFDADTDKPSDGSQQWLAGSLFGTPSTLEDDSSSGYFAPGVRGGANSTTGFNSKSSTNPWDFVLTIEGLVMFTGTATKRLCTQKGDASFPFCVKAASGGYASGEAKEASEGKGEIWLPIWENGTRLEEMQFVFSEGRGSIGRRLARDGVDFARAVVSLGVDRGISSFQRYGILPRFGDSYFASPLQRIVVRRDFVIADLLSACDTWISKFIPAGKAKTAPNSVRRVSSRLEAAIFSRAAAPNLDNSLELLVSLGACEKALSKAQKWRERPESYIHPIPPLSRAWVKQCDTGAPEYRLAAALASLGGGFGHDYVPLRRHLEAVRIDRSPRAFWDDDLENEVISAEGKASDLLCGIMNRRQLLAKAAGFKSWPETSQITAWPSDIAAFIEGRFDDDRFLEFLCSLSLVDFSGNRFSRDEAPLRPSDDTESPAFFAQLKLCFAKLPDDRAVPIEPHIFNLAAAGDGERASKQALRRLHASSIPVTHVNIPLEGEAARRSAAALLFPLWDTQLAMIGRTVAPDFFPDNRVSSKNSTP
jgi:CRISPR-associated protein Csx17